MSCALGLRGAAAPWKGECKTRRAGMGGGADRDAGGCGRGAGPGWGSGARSGRAEDYPLAVVNPVLVVEVSSPSTEEYDRGEKLRHYKSLPSLRAVVIASHREPRLTLYRRQDEDWAEETVGPGQVFSVECVTARISVDEVYRGGLEDLG